MKKIFLSALSVFLVCLLCFGISYWILGYRRSYSYSDQVTSIRGKFTIFSGDYSRDQQWTVLNEFPYVTINSAGVKTVIGRSNSDRITLNLENPGNRAVHAEAVYSGQDLTLEVRSTNVTFDISNMKFGVVSWLEDIFTGKTDIILTIGFPESIYDQINVRLGSGEMQINDLYSRNYDIEIGSGKCEFSRSSDAGFKSNRFNLDLGSGKAVFSGMETEAYYIDIGSGHFELAGLCGDGEINMGSGSGSIAFCDKPDDDSKHKLNMGSGGLALYYPGDSGVVLETKFGSGKITIDGFGADKTITSSNCDEFDEIKLGAGISKLKINMGSGNVTVYDDSAYTAPVIISEFKVFVIGNYDDEQSEIPGIIPAEVISGVEITSGTDIGLILEGGEKADSSSCPVSEGEAVTIASEPEDGEFNSSDVSQEAA